MAGDEELGKKIVDGAVEKVTDVADAGVDAAKGALGAVGGLVGGLGKKAKAAAEAVVEKAGDVVGDVAETAKGAVDGVVDTVGDVAGGAIDKAKELASGAGGLVEGAVGKVTDVAGDAVDAAKGIVGGVAGAATDVAGGAIDKAKELAAGAGDLVEGAVGKVTDVAGDAVDAAKGIVGGVAGAATDVAGDAVDAVKGVGGVALGAGAAVLGGAAAVAGGLGKSVKDVAGGAVGVVGDVAGGAVGAVGDVANAVTGKKSGLLLPLLAIAGIGGLLAYGLVTWANKGAAPTASVSAPAVALPAWLTGVGDKLKASFPWLTLGFNGGAIVASGEAADKNAKEAALSELAMAVEASEGKGASIVDNIKVVGSNETPVGAALAKLGANPDVAACGAAFTETMAGRTINFATGKAIINSDSQSLLGALTGIATACKAHKIEVAGHTDAKGNAEANKALSQARADAVAKFWTDKGVAAAGLTAVGYGQEKLLDTSGTSEGDAKNRRVEFVVSEAAAAAAPAASVESPIKH